MDNAVKLTRVKNGVTVTIDVEGDGARRKSRISLYGKPSRETQSAADRLQASSFEPMWVMNQVMKTIK